MLTRRDLLKIVGAAMIGDAALKSPQTAQAADMFRINPAALVNPFIGTGAHGHTFPGATVPFGMVQLSPDNGVAGWDWCSGYHYSSDVIKCFSHTHLSGTGIGDMYDLGLMPTFAAPGQPVKDWRSKFSHTQEEAAAGYYAVTLADTNIKAELTATERVGVHRYTFPAPPAGQKATVILDLGHSLNWDTPTDTLLQVKDTQTITGYRYSKGWARDQKLYFEARFSQPFVCEMLKADGSREAAQKVKSPKACIALTFADTKQPLEIYVALSPVSSENATANLEREIGAANFDTLRANARAAWEKPLGAIAIETSDKDAQTIFYTALYHALLAPTLFCDADKSYRGPDGKIHHPLESGSEIPNLKSGIDQTKNQISNSRYKTPKAIFQNYSTYSLWDTFRAAHPLYTLIQPERVDDLVQSMMAFYRQHGTLPVWTLAGNETGTMIGYHSVPVIVDAYAKGLTKIDPREALAAMKQSAWQRRLGLQYYQMPEPTTLEELQKAAAKEELPRIATLDEKTLAQYGPLVAGYAKSVSGPNIHYHSAYPHVKEALIARCEDGKNVVEWETAVWSSNFSLPASADPDAKPPKGGTLNASAVTFAWLAGIDVDGDGHRFDLFVNGAKWFAFNNPKMAPPHSFSVKADNGAQLDFHATHQDQFGDLFGYMFLTVPRSLLMTGQPLRLKVVGENANADDWYMTFEHEIGNRVKFSNVFALLKVDGRKRQVVRADFEYADSFPRELSASIGYASDTPESEKLPEGEFDLLRKQELKKRYQQPTRISFGAMTTFFPVQAVSKSIAIKYDGGEYVTGSLLHLPEPWKPQTEPLILNPVLPFAYIPCELEGESVSKTLEYAYDDWCIAEFARRIGAKEDAAVFDKRAQSYRNLFDKTTGFMRGKTSEGKWAEPFTPGFSDKQQHHYTEGNAWQYTWSVQHDVPGLIELLGGPEKFVAKLDELFDQKVDLTGKNAPPDVSGLIGEYAHGNEPSHHIAYLYALAGYAWKTQERVRHITRTLYHNTPEGLCGNEDCGQMSAWYIFSTLGFYPVNPANGIYVIGAPHFPAVTLNFGNKQFRITARNVSEQNFYIQSAALNGKPLSRCWITHQEIVAGGTLEFVMGEKPNQSWGRL